MTLAGIRFNPPPRQGNQRHLSKLFYNVVALAVLSSAIRIVFCGDDTLNDFMARHGGRFNFFTVWGLVGCTLLFAIKVLDSLFPGTSVLHDGEKLLRMISLPVESLICALYWPLVTFKPELMIPAGLQARSQGIMLIPLTKDLQLHLLPAILLWLDHLFFSEPTLDGTNHVRLMIGPKLHSSWVLLIYGLAYTTRVELTTSLQELPSFPYPFLNGPIYVRYLIYLGAFISSTLILRTTSSLGGKPPTFQKLTPPPRVI